MVHGTWYFSEMGSPRSRSLVTRLAMDTQMLQMLQKLLDYRTSVSCEHEQTWGVFAMTHSCPICRPQIQARLDEMKKSQLTPRNHSKKKQKVRDRKIARRGSYGIESL